MSYEQAGKTALRLSMDEKRALELKDAGLTIRQIAAEMNSSVGAAWNRVVRGIRKLPQEIAQTVRDKEVAECDMLMVDAITRSMESGEMKDFFMGIKSVCMLKDRKARFLGLDSPKETRNVNIDSMSDGELKRKAIELLGGNPDEKTNPEDNPST